MKKMISLFISLTIFFSFAPMTSAATAVEAESTVIGVSTWKEFYEAFQQTYADASAESYVIKLESDLTMDLTTASAEKQGYLDVSCYGFVTFDLNGHTLSCTDIDPESELNPTKPRKDFITITLLPIDDVMGSELLITDSVGGGGITMEAYRNTDSEISALCIQEATINRMKVPYTLCTTPVCKLTIDGGTYSLRSRIRQVDMGTDDRTTNYRGTVIADRVGTIEINGGSFWAYDLGFDYGMPGDEWGTYGVSDRELTAFGTCCYIGSATVGVSPMNLTINGGLFNSSGYSIHHFFSALSEAYAGQDVIEKLTFPTINGGVFEGAIGYIGRSGVECAFGNPIEELKERTLDTIINEDSFVHITIDDGYHNYILKPDNVTFDEANCHDFWMMVIGEKLINLETTPATDGETTYLTRNTSQIDNFTVTYTIPDYLGTRIYINPFIYVGEDRYSGYGQDYVEVYYGNYPDQTVSVQAGIEVISIDDTRLGMTFYNTYEITVEAPKPLSIVPRPATPVRVEPGEWAEMTVKANHAESYQWYMIDDTFGKIPFGDNVFTSLIDGIEGYHSETLRIMMKEPCKIRLYCVITGTDGTTQTTATRNMYFGDFPEVRVFDGGEYEEGGDATFTIWADYAETLTWMVVDRGSGSASFYNLKDFAEESGFTYTETHQKMPSGIYKATVTFHNVTKASVNKISVGYKMSNAIGTTEFNPENVLPFTLKEIRPQITKDLEPASCLEGDSLTYTIQAMNMTDAEWRFEKPDEDGIAIAYGIDELREAFPESSFIPSFETDSETGESTATLVIQNARYEMCDYTLYAYASSSSGIYLAGYAQLEVIPVKNFEITDCQNSGSYITVCCPEEGDYTLYIAGYDSFGKLEAVEIAPLHFTRGKASYNTQKPLADYPDIRVMLWDNLIIPLCPLYQK